MGRKISDIMLNSKGFDNPYFEALMGIMLATNQHLKRQQEFFEPYGITPPQYNALRILRGQSPNPCSLNLVKERIVDKNSDVSRLIERLRKLGLVTRVQNAVDRRAVDILITQDGLDLLARLDPLVDDLWRLPGLSEGEARELIAYLEKILQ